MPEKKPGSLEIVKKVYFFNQLDENELKCIADLVRFRDYSRGELIFREGEAGESIFLLCNGLIKLSKLNEEGKEQILHYVHPGGVFAEVVLFDGGSYPATAEAVEDSLVGVLDNKDMERLILSNSKLALAMLKMMSKRLRAAQLVIRDLALYDADRRLARLLIKLAGRHGKVTSRGIKLNTWITRQEMANVIGTTRETVGRILSRFQKEGFLVIHKGAIYLKTEFLEALGNGEKGY